MSMLKLCLLDLPLWDRLVDLIICLVYLENSPVYLIFSLDYIDISPVDQEYLHVYLENTTVYLYHNCLFLFYCAVSVDVIQYTSALAVAGTVEEN